MSQQLECRIVITHWGRTFDLGMYDPVGMRYEPLGNHQINHLKHIVRDLKTRIEQERFIVTFSEVSGPRTGCKIAPSVAGGP